MTNLEKKEIRFRNWLLFILTFIKCGIQETLPRTFCWRFKALPHPLPSAKKSKLKGKAKVRQNDDHYFYYADDIAIITEKKE